MSLEHTPSMRILAIVVGILSACGSTAVVAYRTDSVIPAPETCSHIEGSCGGGGQGQEALTVGIIGVVVVAGVAIVREHWPR